MLAKEYRGDYVELPYYLQPKLNGHRAVWDGYKLWSRNGKEIISVPGILNQLSTYFLGKPVDGELFCPSMSLQEITKVVRRTVNIQDDPQICLYIYDIPIEKVKYKDRLDIITTEYADIIDKNHCNRMKILESVEYDRLIKHLNIFGAEYEGTMLRNSSGLYEFGKRSSQLLKIKKFHDMEATIIGVEQYYTYEKILVSPNTPGSTKRKDGTWVKDGEAKAHKMVGAFICRLDNGIEFRVGSGLGHKLRKQYWKNPPIGQILTFKYQDFTDEGVPSFPIFLQMREDI
jgi:DNA ligase-1